VKVVQVRESFLGIRIRELDRRELWLSEAERRLLRRAAVVMDGIRDQVLEDLRTACRRAGVPEYSVAEEPETMDLCLGAEAARSVAEAGVVVLP
jgi:hypothetical protein